MHYKHNLEKSALLLLLSFFGNIAWWFLSTLEAKPDWVLKLVLQLISFATLDKLYTLSEHWYFYLLSYYWVLFIEKVTAIIINIITIIIPSV